jgi:hypothetical protein
MQVYYETTTVQPPTDTRQTDITTYMWPGYLGEWDAETKEFRAWQLVSSNYWIPAPDIKVPPMKCIGILTESTWVWTLSKPAGTEYHSQAGSTHRILAAASSPALLVR